jgi:hypothetical protein
MNELTEAGLGAGLCGSVASLFMASGIYREVPEGGGMTAGAGWWWITEKPYGQRGLGNQPHPLATMGLAFNRPETSTAIMRYSCGSRQLIQNRGA